MACKYNFTLPPSHYAQSPTTSLHTGLPLCTPISSHSTLHYIRSLFLLLDTASEYRAVNVCHTIYTPEPSAFAIGVTMLQIAFHRLHHQHPLFHPIFTIILLLLGIEASMGCSPDRLLFAYLLSMRQFFVIFLRCSMLIYWCHSEQSDVSSNVVYYH